MTKRAKVKIYTKSVSAQITPEMYDSIISYCEEKNIGISDLIRMSVNVFFCKNVGSDNQ